MNETLFRDLIEVARARRTITYQEAAEVVRLDLRSSGQRAELSAMLRAISLHEHQQGRPLLSVVVVSEATNFPGRGFFRLLESLCFTIKDTEEAVYERELSRVHEHWARAASLP
jgi:hypothetical protein